MSHAVLSIDVDAAAGRARNELLRGAGFEIVEAASGAEALRLASEKQPALAVLAIDLPEMDGLEVCRRLKADPRTAAIPVLHIAGPGEPYRYYPESLASGALAYLQEPYAAATLAGVATALIRARSGVATAPATGDDGAAKDPLDASGGIAGSVSVVRDITARKHAEEALRAAQSRNAFLADLLEHADQPFAIGYPDGSLGFLNSAFERLTGYTREDLRGMDWVAALTPPEWRDLERTHLEELHRTRRPVRYEKEYLRKDGTRVPIELLVHLSSGDRGQPLYYCFLTDLIARKEAEQALRDSEAQFRTLANAIPQLCWIANADGWIFWYNQRWYDYTGATPEQMKGWGWQSVHDPEALPRVLDEWQASIATGLPFDMVFPLRGADGVFRPFLTRITPVFDRDGKVARWFGTNTDIGELRQAQEALLRQSEWLRVTLSSIGDAVFATGTDGRIAFLNPVAAALTGWTEEQALGRPAQDVFRTINEDTREQAGDIVARVLREASHVTLANHTALVARDGREIPIEDSAAPILDAAGHVIGAVLVFHDVTGKRRAQQALRESEERYRALFETMSEGFALCEIVCDDAGKPSDYRHLAVNPAFERQTGIKTEHILAHTSLETLPGAEPIWLERYGRVALTGEPARFEAWFGPLGRWLEVSAFQTEPGRFGVVFSDVTARKRAEEERQRLAAELADRVGELQAILDAAPVAIWIAHDPQCLRITGNAYADKIVMQGPRGGNVSHGAPPDDKSVSYKVFRRGVELRSEELPNQIAAATGRPVTEDEQELVFPDGRRVHLLLGGMPLFDSAGRARGSVVAGLDVTQRRRAEEALRENEAVLRSFFDSAGVIRGIVDIVEGGIVHVACNAAAAEMFGIDRDSIAGKTAEQAGASEEVARQWVALYEKSRLTGQPVSMEYSRRDAAGRDRWMLATANYLGTGPSGHPRFAYTALDLTARKRVEEALRESEERLRLAQNSGGVGVWEWNPRTETLHLTPEFEQLYGLAPGTLKTNQDWRRLVHPDDLTEVEAKRDAAVAKHEPFEMEFRILHASGEIRWLSGKGGAIYDDAGDPMRVFGVNIDITVRKLAEERLRQSESHLRNLGDNLPQGAIYQYRVDAAGRHHVDFISAGIERLTGVPAAEFVEDVEAVFRHIVPEDRDKLQAEIARSREGLTRFEAEVRHIQSLTGELRWSLLRSTPSRLPDGSTVWDGIELDITERKRAEQALRESEERFRIMADGCPTMIWVTGAGGEQRFVNRTYQEFFGVTFEQLEESGWQPLVHPDDAPAYVEAAQRAVRERAPFRAEARVRNGHGEWRWVASHAEPRRSAGGEFLGHVGITLDITESRQAEEAVRNSRKQLQDIIDGSPGVVFVKDLEGRFITANQAFERFLGMTREELRGKTDYDIMTRERADRYRENDRRVAETGEPIQIEEVADLADGRQHVFLANKFPLRDASGKIYAVCAISTDITAMKQAEERLRQSQKLESLGLLAGGVAHDFNNLLVGVIGNASLAQEMLPPGDPAAELIEAVVKTGEQAAHLTRQMLAYSGKGKFVVEALDLSALIPEISALVRPSVSKKIALHFDMAPGLPLIEADRGQVQQVFMNLVLNAAEAIGSQDGLISIRTGVENVDQRYSHLHPETAELRPGRYVFLEVRDSGCGMDEATRAKIFDPFFSTKFTGRGLGLAAVSGILRGHQGAIVVSSAPGQGSCFTVLFPAEARAARQPKPALVDAALQGAGVILVVDDEPLVRQMAKTALERHGYTVLVAESGPVAIDVFRRYPGQIALVVLDLSMPQMSGEETLPELNKIRPGVKVVVSSGYSETEAMNLFRGQRVAGFIQKPYNSKGLAEKVKVYLG